MAALVDVLPSMCEQDLLLAGLKVVFDYTATLLPHFSRTGPVAML